MFQDDRSYYRQRAEAEIARARRTTEPCVVRAHSELAQACLQKLATFDPATLEAA